MSVPSWWTATLNPKGLSQGDIVTNVPVGMTVMPMTYVERVSVQAKGKRNWIETSRPDPFKTDGAALYFSRGKLKSAIVVSHSCELDKPDSNRVLIAPIAPLSQVTDLEAHARILERKRRAYMPLPELPALGDHYADLRCIMFLDRKHIPDGNRRFSMTNEGIVMLQAQLIAYLARLDPDLVEKALTKGMSQQA